jgi:peptidyl-prolyl cis-trans isomerase SurA
MKSIYTKIAIIFLLFHFATDIVVAKEIVKENKVDTINKISAVKKQKIDGVIAKVGDYIILDSDIDKSFLEISSQGGSVKDITRCQILGKIMEDKLYAHQAVQDSVKVTDGEVKSMMEDRLNYMIEQIGSMDKVVKYYKKNTEEDFRSYFFDILKEQRLTSEMQKKIVEAVEITPEEVRNFFKKIPAADLPVFGAEMEVAQIITTPKVSEAEKQKVINRLNEFKKEVQEGGSSFATKAVLYSQDPGSRATGGYYKMNKKTQFVKEFKEVAFSLAEGEISAPF